MRLINYIDRETSEVKQIRAIKNPMISKYEILVPLNYRTFYRGCETYLANCINADLKDFMIEDCSDAISIINLDSKPIDYIVLSDDASENDVLDLYKYIVANCIMVLIILNGDKSLSEIEVAYEVNGNLDEDGNYPIEYIHLLHEDCEFDSDNICIAKEEY